MIFLTKLDNKKILINLESVKYIESVPDTLVFFLNGDSIMVKESLEQVACLVTVFKAAIMKGGAVSGGPPGRDTELRDHSGPQ